LLTRWIILKRRCLPQLDLKVTNFNEKKMAIWPDVF
jgi:hypothetical protein